MYAFAPIVGSPVDRTIFFDTILMGGGGGGGGGGACDGKTKIDGKWDDIEFDNYIIALEHLAAF